MDLGDYAADLQQQEIDRVLAARKAATVAAGDAPAPRDTCAMCNDPLPPTRRAMGAQLCVKCQREMELDRGVGR